MSPFPPPETTSTYTRSGSQRRPPRSSPRGSPTASIQSDDTPGGGGGGSATFSFSYDNSNYLQKQQQQQHPQEEAAKRKPSSSRRRRSSSSRKGKEHPSSSMFVDNIPDYGYREGGAFDDDELNYSSSLSSSSSSSHDFFLNNDGGGVDEGKGGRRRRKRNDGMRNFRSSSLPSSFDDDVHHGSAGRKNSRDGGRHSPSSNFDDDRHERHEHYDNIPSPRSSFSSGEKKSSAEWAQRLHDDERAAAAAAAAALNNQLETIDAKTQELRKSWRNNSRKPPLSRSPSPPQPQTSYEKDNSDNDNEDFKKLSHRSMSSRSIYNDRAGEVTGSRNRANTDPFAAATDADSSKQLESNKVRRKSWRISRSSSRKALLSRSPSPSPRSLKNEDNGDEEDNSVLNRPRSDSFHDKVEEIRNRRNRANTDPFPSAAASSTQNKTEKKTKKKEAKDQLETAPSIDALEGNGSNSFDYFFPSNIHHPAAVEHSKKHHKRTESNSSSSTSLSQSQMGYYDDIFAAATNYRNGKDHEKVNDDDDDNESIKLSECEKDDDNDQDFFGSHPLLDDDPIRRNIIEGKYSDDEDDIDEEDDISYDEEENGAFENEMIENEPTVDLEREEKTEEKEDRFEHAISPRSSNSLAASLTKWISPTQKVLTPEVFDDNQLSSSDNDQQIVHTDNSTGLADDEQSFGSCSSISSAVSIMTGTLLPGDVGVNGNENNEHGGGVSIQSSADNEEEDEEIFFDTESYAADEENEAETTNLLPPPLPAPSPFPSYTPFRPPYLSSPFPSHDSLLLDARCDEGDGISPLHSPVIDNSKSGRKLLGAPQCSFSLLDDSTIEDNAVWSKHSVEGDKDLSYMANEVNPPPLSSALISDDEKAVSTPGNKKTVSFSSPFSSSEKRLAGINKMSAQSSRHINSVPSSQSSTTSSQISPSSKQKRSKSRTSRLLSALSLRNIRKNRSLLPQRTMSMRSSSGRGDDANHNDVKGDDMSSLDPAMLLPLHEESGDELYVYENEEDVPDYDFTNLSMSTMQSPHAGLPVISEEVITQQEDKKKHHIALQRMYASLPGKHKSTDGELSVTSSVGTDVGVNKKMERRRITSFLSRRRIKEGTSKPGSSSSLPDLHRQSSRSLDSSTQSLHDRLGCQRRSVSKRNLMDTSTSSQSLRDSQSLGDGSFLTSRSFQHLDSEASDSESFSTARSRSHLHDKLGMKNKSVVRPELLEDDYDDYFDEVRDILSDCDSDKSGNGDDNKNIRSRSSTSDTQSVSSGAFSKTFNDLRATIINKSMAFHGADRRSTFEDKHRAKRSKEAASELLKIRMKRREEAAVAVLRSKHGFPTGLARVCYRVSLHYLPLRIWIVDNSGSMSMGDGRRFLDGNKNVAAGRKAGRVSQMINCTRWEELRDSVLFHAEMASDLGAPTMFRLLNNPSLALNDISDCESCDEDTHMLPQVVGVCARRNDELEPKKVANGGRKSGGVLTKFFGKVKHTRIGDVTDDDEEKYDWEGMWEVDLGALDDTDFDWMDRAQDDLKLVTSVMYEVEPRYKTPLTHHMWAIYDQVKHMKKYLRPNQKVAIVIATDGLPDEHDAFLNAMRMMQKLPVYVIVRLCTDDEAAMHFWKTLDLDLNILVEILDDFESEAHQVYSMNPWITYSLPLQRIREWGYRSEILEKLRERPLTIEEVRDCCALIFGVPSSMLCDPETDWLGFREDIEALASNESRQWHPVLRKTKRWINITKLGEIYGGKAEKRRLKMLRKTGKEKKMQEKKRKEERRSMKKRDQQRAKGHHRMDSMKLRKKRLQLAASVRHLSTVAQSAMR